MRNSAADPKAERNPTPRFPQGKAELSLDSIDSIFHAVDHSNHLSNIMTETED